MNCKNVEPLLPLYVGRDLEEERSRLVAAHLQSCTECTLAADEYAQAGQLLQEYEPPFFGDETYAGIRQQVLNQIEGEFNLAVRGRIFSQFYLALVQPRMRWITAALLLAISVTALYWSRTHSHQLPDDGHVAGRTEEPNQAGTGTEVRAGHSNPSNREQDRKATTRHPITGKRKASGGVVAANRSRQLDNPTKVNVSTNDPVVQHDVDGSQPSSTHGPLRVEMQTSDRNIRIIWLSGQRPPAGSDGSKGL